MTRFSFHRTLPVTTLALLAAARLSAAEVDGAAAPAPAPTATIDDREALLKRLDALDARVNGLEKDLETEKEKERAVASSRSQSGLIFGAYGEVKFGVRQNPDDDGAWQNGFDSGRLALMPSYQLNDYILFKAEIDFEHGGIAFANDDKLGGAIEVEQAFIDITVNERLHWRPPGVDLVPFGYTNLYHEPTLFYSVDRPQLANGLIPTTWFAGSTSILGILAGPVTYQFQISSSLVDDGGNVNDRSPEGGPAALGYDAGVNGQEALSLARPTTGDFSQETNALGYALRLAYDVPTATGLAGSTSVYFSPNIVPRHAYASDAAGVTVGELDKCSLIMFDTEMRYRPARSGIELRGEGLIEQFSSPANLRANNDGDAENNVGRIMWGASAEIAWHVITDGGWDVVPFGRFTSQTLQTSGVAGLDDNTPSGSGKAEYYTVGLAVFPVPELVFKVDYQAVRDDSSAGPQSDSVLGGVGFLF